MIKIMQADSLQEYQELLENAQKRDAEYQRMAKDSEERILELIEANQSLQSQLLSKDKLISKYELELKSAAALGHQMTKVELSADVEHVAGRQHADESRVAKLTEISAKISKINEQFERRIGYVINNEFHVKTNVIKKAIAVAKAKLETDRANKLSNELALKVSEVELLKDEVSKVWLSI